MIKTRIAPSPTGKLHIGTVIISLYNWIIARQNNWKFIMRIEDTDLARSTKENEDNIIKWLKRLGLDYDIWPDKEDENWPYRQMERLDIYQKYIEQLIQEWKAYYARETDEELKELRETAKKQKKGFIYRQRKYTNQEIEQFKNEWRKAIIRFKVEPKIIEFTDMVKGELKFDMTHFGDYAIQKSDWSPTFYIANVIDDYLMWMTHIIRWEDHVSNTPKQILLYDAFWWKHPQYGHLALLLNPDWTKMSKRTTGNALTIEMQTDGSVNHDGFAASISCQNYFCTLN
jgi:glutamyl-tRNA synthetase